MSGTSDVPALWSEEDFKIARIVSSPALGASNLNAASAEQGAGQGGASGDPPNTGSGGGGASSALQLGPRVGEAQKLMLSCEGRSEMRLSEWTAVS